LYLPNIWPTHRPEFKEKLENLYGQAQALSYKLMDCFSLALGLEKDFFYKRSDKGPSVLKLNFYPAGKKPENCETRLGQHRDRDFFTILYSTDFTSLSYQLQNSDAWVTAPTVKDSVIVFVGEMLSYWTARQWPSVLHKVMWDSETKERLSIAYFVGCNYDVLIDPAGITGKFLPPMTVLDYDEENWPEGYSPY